MSNRRTAAQIQFLIIHCSATPNGKPFTAADIDSWHQQRGFTRTMALFPHHQPTLNYIGYHWVNRINGVAECGRYELETGAHCIGYNTNGIGICMVGTDAFSLEQWATLKAQVEIFKKRYPGIQVMGHRDTSPDTNHNGRVDPQEWLKTCPGFDVATWLAGGMAPLVGHILPGSH